MKRVGNSNKEYALPAAASKYKYHDVWAQLDVDTESMTARKVLDGDKLSTLEKRNNVDLTYSITGKAVYIFGHTPAAVEETVKVLDFLAEAAVSNHSPWPWGGFHKANPFHRKSRTLSRPTFSMPKATSIRATVPSLPMLVISPTSTRLCCQPRFLTGAPSLVLNARMQLWPEQFPCDFADMMSRSCTMCLSWALRSAP